MKLFFAIMLLSQSLAFATDSSTAPAPAKDRYNQLSIDKSMQQLLEIEGVNTIYKSCIDSYAQSTAQSDYSSKISSCLWDGVKDNDKLKAEVTQFHADLKKKETEASRAPASDNEEKKETEKSLATKKLNVTIGTHEDPAIKALSDFYAKKFDEVLNPQKALTKAERDAGMVAIVDHTKYIELYKSALGKTIINAFTSYCMEANETCGTDSKICTPEDGPECKNVYSCAIPNDETERENNRTANTKKFSEGNIDLSKDGPDSKKWVTCIQEVTPICTDSKEGYAKDRACIIVDYVKSARVNLQLTEEQIKFYADLDKRHQRVGTKDGFKRIDTGEEASADALSSLTSKDVKDSLKVVEEKSFEAINKCYSTDEEGNNAKILDADACKDFLNTNKEESTRALAEFELRQNIQSDALKVELQDEANLNKYLKDEGYTPEEIAKLLEDPNSLSIVREKIINRFDSEKKALIEEMKNKIADTTTSVEGEVTQEDISKLEKIKKELVDRSSDLASSVQFNNIVSSYLDYEDSQSGETGRNVAGLFAEVGSMTEEQAKVINDKIKDAELVNKKSSVELSLKNLNNIFLRYTNGDDKK